MTIPLYHSFAIITSPKSPKGFWSSKLYQTYGVGNLFCRRRPCGRLGHSPLGFPPFTHARQMARLLIKKNSMFETSFKQRLFLIFECRANRARMFAKSQTKKRADNTKNALFSLPKMASFPLPNARSYHVPNIVFRRVLLTWYTFSFLLVQSYYFLMYSVDKQPVLMLRPRPKM